MTRTGSFIRWRWPITASPDATTPSRSVCPTATARRAHWVVGTSSCTSVASRAGRSTWAGDPLTGSSAPARDGSHTLTSPTSWRLYRSECGFDVPDFDRRRASMRQTVQFTLAAALIGLAAAACGEGTAPTSGQAEVLAAEADQLGAMADSTALAAELDGGGCEPADRHGHRREDLSQRHAARRGHRCERAVRRGQPHPPVPCG